MNFDIDRYKNRRLHKDDEIDKKIKALFLWFDYEVSRKKLSLTNQLNLIDDWIRKFEEAELYEVIPMFKLRRSVILKTITTKEEDNMSFLEQVAPNLDDRIKKIINSIKSLFRRK